jgi:hypothetical protein
MSKFNAEAFMQTSTKQSNDTKLIPVPQGDRPAMVKKILFRDGVKDGVAWVAMDLIWHVLDDESKKTTGMDTPTVKQSIFLDLTAEGALDMSKGKNVQLGKVREALGQNKEGRAWSPGQLQGVPATILVSHRPDEKTGDTYADVKAVAPQGQATGKAKAA